jgi:ferredoxin
MSESYERPVGDLLLRIDRERCVGFGHCVEEAPAAFRLSDQAVVEFVVPEQATREELERACEACPVAALTLLEGDTQVAP